MIVINNKKFAKNDAEFTETLFHADGTAIGYYKVSKKDIKFYDHNHEIIGFLCNNVLGKARKLHNGKVCYCYCNIEKIGEFESYTEEKRQIEELTKRFNLKVIY